MRIMRLFCLLLLVLLCVGGFSAFAQQEGELPRIYASDMTGRGRIIAIALQERVEIYDMRDLTQPPRVFELEGVLSLAFTSAPTLDHLAMGTRTGITVIDWNTMEVVNQTDQPASALAWIQWDNRLVTGWQDQLTILEASEIEQAEPYSVLRTVTAYQTLDDTIATNRNIVSLHVLSDDGDEQVYVTYGYDLNYGNHGETRSGVSRYDVSDYTVSDVPESIAALIYTRRRVLFGGDGRYSFIGNIWSDYETGYTVVLPLEENS